MGSAHFVIVPEGQHRFYLEGTDGRVGASWMTKEDRESDIVDQHSYLDAVMKEALAHVDMSDFQVVAFGFSQGAATISRYIMARRLNVHSLVLWAGMFPPDADPRLAKEHLADSDVYLLFGDSDPYITDDRMHVLTDMMDKSGIAYDTIGFQGEHTIPTDVLGSLADRITRK